MDYESFRCGLSVVAKGGTGKCARWPGWRNRQTQGTQNPPTDDDRASLRLSDPALFGRRRVRRADAAIARLTHPEPHSTWVRCIGRRGFMRVNGVGYMAPSRRGVQDGRKPVTEWDDREVRGAPSTVLFGPVVRRVECLREQYGVREYPPAVFGDRVSRQLPCEVTPKVEGRHDAIAA